MLALLDPRVWLVALALMLGAYATGRWQQYQHDNKAQDAGIVKLTNAARDKEAGWQSDAHTVEELHDEELRRIAGQHVRDLAGVRDRAQRLPEAARAACNGAGATGEQLSEPDARFLIGEAATADRTAADLRACQAWVKIVTAPNSQDTVRR